MSIRLLDVNVLLSILDPKHVHHQEAVKWFRKVAAASGWATTPITENGFIRIVSQSGYPNGSVTPAVAGAMLEDFKLGFSGIHRFWADEISLSDSKFFDLKILTSSRHTTDAYLAGLAFHNRGRFSTLDGGVRWRAVRGADATLIDRIVP